MSETDVFCPNCGNKLNHFPSSENTTEKTTVEEQKSREDENRKIVTGILAIILGGLGIHYFYIGKTTAGLIAILLSFCSCGIWPVITLIQGILILLMSDDEFKEKYIDTDQTFPLF